MAEKVLKAKKRKELGSAPSSRLRRDGFTPVVLYGKEYESTNLAIETRELSAFMRYHGLGSKLMLDVEGKEEMAIVKEIQKHPVTGKFLHLDFLHLTAGQKVKISIPVHFVGTEKVAADLVVQKLVNEVEIEAFPKDLIDYITVDVAGLGIGGAISIGDIDRKEYPGIEFIDEDDTNLVIIVEASKYEEPEATAEESDDLLGAVESAEEGSSEPEEE